MKKKYLIVLIPLTGFVFLMYVTILSVFGVPIREHLEKCNPYIQKTTEISKQYLATVFQDPKK